MIELLQIILIFFIFGLIITVPINVFNSKLLDKKNRFNLDIASFNLLLNCNILLLLSIVPVALSSYNFIYILISLLIFVYTYIYKNFELKKYKKSFEIILIFFVIFFIISVSVATELKFGWDAKYFYYTKALFFVEDQILYDIKRFIFGTWHPHLGSYYWAFFWNLMPIQSEYFGRLFYVFILIFTLFYLCHDNLEDKFRNTIIFILLILLFYNYERFSGLQEVLIFSFLAILSKYFSKLKHIDKKYYIFFIILGCNLIIWLKVEGIVYSSILILLLIFTKHIPNKLKIYSSIFFIGLVIFKIIIYQFFNEKTNFLVEASGHPYHLEYIYNINLDFILNKLKYIIPYLVYYILNNIFFISGILILIMLNFKKNSDDYIKVINLYFILNVIFIFTAYIFRDMEVEYSVKSTMERVVFTSSGFFVFLVIDFFKKLKINFNK